MSGMTGQVAIVSGAGRGIGRAIAERLAAEGAQVALASRTEAELNAVAEGIRAAGGTALAVPTDVTDNASVLHLIQRAEAELGPLDLLVNNAGSFYAIGPSWEVDAEKWWTDVTINVRGVFLPCHAAAPGMVARNRGRIINLIGGGTGSPFPYGGGYASSKAAVMRFTETLQAELAAAKSAVTAFAMGPGLVRTRLTEYQLESSEGQQWMHWISGAFEGGRDVPPTKAAELTVALASGRFDRLAGRCFGVGEDLDDILARQEEILRQDGKTLRFR